MSDDADKKAQMRRHQRDLDIREVLSSPAGQRLVWGLIEGTRVFGSSHTGDALATAFNEGQRAVGLRLLREVQTSAPTQLEAMLTEFFRAPRAAEDGVS